MPPKGKGGRGGGKGAKGGPGGKGGKGGKGGRGGGKPIATKGLSGMFERLDAKRLESMKAAKAGAKKATKEKTVATQKEKRAEKVKEKRAGKVRTQAAPLYYIYVSPTEGARGRRWLTAHTTRCARLAPCEPKPTIRPSQRRRLPSRRKTWTTTWTRTGRRPVKPKPRMPRLPRPNRPLPWRRKLRRKPRSRPPRRSEGYLSSHGGGPVVKAAGRRKRPGISFDMGGAPYFFLRVFSSVFIELTENGRRQRREAR